jgi:hypothetical protein
LGRLDVERRRADVGRDPFNFGARPSPPTALSGRAFTPPPTAGPPAAPPPPPPAGPPPIALKLTGLFVIPGEAGDRSLVTLKDPSSGAVFQAFEGDVVDGRYRVVKIGLQSVVLAYVDGTGQRTIPLGG